jgi:hypothetical protein
MILVEVLGVVSWVVIGLAGAWFMATGRKVFYGLPRGIREGGPVRIFGLAYAALAGFLFFEWVHNGSFSPQGIIFTYVFFAIAIGVALWQSRKERAGDASAPEA